MAQVTVIGTGTPCAGVLPRGKRATVEVTDQLRKWVAVGCVKVVEGSLDAGRSAHAVDQPEQVSDQGEQANPVRTVDQPVSPPARNGSREKWATFLREQGVPFRDGDPEGEDWDGRDDLIRAWDAHRGG